MGVEDAFDACHSLGAAQRILQTAFAAEVAKSDRQAAILITLSRYNTGRPLAGIANGYANQVIAAQNTLRMATWRRDAPNTSTTMGHLGHLWCRTDVVGRHARTDHLKSKGLGLKPAMHATKGVHRHHRRKKESPMSYLLIRRVSQRKP